MRAVILVFAGMLASMNLAVADGPALTRNGTDATARESVTQLPTWLWGEWSRDWILRGTVKSSPLDVHYLQTPSYFADIRTSKARPGMSAAQSFADLTDEQLRLLAGQGGYTGRTTLTGTVATWSDDISFQPSDGSPDQGRLQRIQPDRMHELGLDGSYTEAWRHVSRSQGAFLVIRVEHSGRLVRTLVVVGNHFIFVRNRTKNLPIASSLQTLIETTKATREDIVKYLDCEFSAGRIRGGSVPWEIQQSTLPWREGHHLDFVDQLSVSGEGTGLAPRAAGDEQWTVPVNTLSPREIKAHFDE